MQRDGTRAALSFIVPIALAVLVLSMAGIVSVQAWAPERGSYQLVFLLFAIAAMLAVQLVNYRALLVLSPMLYGLSLIPILYTVAGRYTTVPLVNKINGAYAWISLGPVSFQPAELAKICVVLLLAWTLRGENASRSLWVLVRSLLLVGLAMVLILQQPDLGTLMTLVPPTLVMVYMAGVKKRHLAGLLLLGILGAPVVWFAGEANMPLLGRMPRLLEGYQRDRVQAMFSDDPRLLPIKYQQERALEAMGSGGVFGKGSGNIPLGRRVPEAHTDMVLSLVGEQFGLLGVGTILLAYMLLFGTGAAIAAEHRDQIGKLLAMGLVTLLAGQMALNMAVAMRLMPVTGVTLPFVSYGGSSLVASFTAAGLLVNVARNQRKVAF